LSEIEPAAVDELGEKRAVMLTEVLDRIELPDLEEVPGADEANQKKVTRWRMPGTEITVEAVADGPRQGEFLFSPETVSRIPEFFDRAKHLPYTSGTVLEEAYDKVFTKAPPDAEKDTPLKPADTSSPQATLRTFLVDMNAAYRAFKEDGMTAEGVARRRESVSRAIGTLNLQEVPPNVVHEVGKETAVLLMEILDRIEIPVIEQVPGTKQVDTSKLKSWTIPDTEITIARIEEGPRRGEFLFSSETVRRAKEFYQGVEHLPYKDGTALEQAYHVYLQASGPMVPTSWVLEMPTC
jgi:MscS family membrane protein